MRNWSELIADPGSTRPIPGTDESVAAVVCRIGGTETVLIWCRFEVAAGTLGVDAGGRFVEAIDAAIAEGLPVMAVANSGGARMQEGPRAFVQMIGVTDAVRRLRSAGLPLVVYLAHPTTGGVLASWASLGDVTLAEPGATIGFTGPRVAEAVGEPIVPPDSQVAEGLERNGLVDALVPAADLAATVSVVLAILGPEDARGAGAEPSASGDDEWPRGWAAVEASRRADRVSILDELLARASGVVELRGDRAGGTDAAVLVALCRVDGRRLLVIGHRHPGDRPGVAGLRLARRGLRIANRLGIAVMTVIDTAGALISGEQETAGLAGEIAASIDDLLGLDPPSTAILAGQGSGGAAMAWLAADRVVAIAAGWLAPIAPEAASAIAHRVLDHAAEMANLQRVGAVELLEAGLIDAVVPENEVIDAALAALGRPIADATRGARRR